MEAFDRLRNAAPEEKNVGGAERVLRGTLGPSLAGLGAAILAGVVSPAPGATGSVLGVLLALAGIRMTQTALTQKCYLNERLGRSSYRPEPTDEGGPHTAESDSPASTRR